MPARLVALDEGAEIPLDQAMIVVGRHPLCNARLDSLRVSRHHCCMTQDHGEVVVRDLGSTNGIRINGQRVEQGRLRPGDELSIAHIRYRLDNGQGHEPTLADGPREERLVLSERIPVPEAAESIPVAIGAQGTPFGLINPPAAPSNGIPGENRLAAAVRELLPSGLADRCRIQVIVQMPGNEEGGTDGASEPKAEEGLEVCQPDSSP